MTIKTRLQKLTGYFFAPNFSKPQPKLMLKNKTKSKKASSKKNIFAILPAALKTNLMREFQLKPVFIILLIFISLSVFSQNLKISEIMSVNLQTIADEDGEYSDWIEIYNAGNETVELQNFFLSDKKVNLYKCQFPEEKLKPGKTK